jgi:hypothetical protein
MSADMEWTKPFHGIQCLPAGKKTYELQRWCAVHALAAQGPSSATLTTYTRNADNGWDKTEQWFPTVEEARAEGEAWLSRLN